MTSMKQRGFSLLEMLITVSIGFTIAGITFIAMMPMFNRNHVDLAYDTTLMALRNTRHLAITQSHQYFVNFNPGGFPGGDDPDHVSAARCGWHSSSRAAGGHSCAAARC